MIFLHDCPPFPQTGRTEVPVGKVMILLRIHIEKSCNGKYQQRPHKRPRPVLFHPEQLHADRAQQNRRRACCKHNAVHELAVSIQQQKRRERRQRCQRQPEAALFPAQRVHDQRIRRRIQQRGILARVAHRDPEHTRCTGAHERRLIHADRAEHKHCAIDVPRVPAQAAVIQVIPADKRAAGQKPRCKRENIRRADQFGAQIHSKHDGKPGKEQNRRLLFGPVYRVERKSDGLRIAHLPDGLGLRRILRHALGQIRLGLLFQMRPQFAFQRGAHALPAHLRSGSFQIPFDPFSHRKRLPSTPFRPPAYRRSIRLPSRTAACALRPSGDNTGADGPRRTVRPAR